MIEPSRAALIATSIAAIWAASPLPAAAQNAAATCGTPSFANRAGLNAVAGSNLVTVPLTINGAPKQFLLDVGTAPDEISEVAANELHLTRADRHTADPTAQNTTTFRFEVPVVDVKRASGAGPAPAQVTADAVTLGEVTLPDMKFLISSDRDLGKAKPYDGRFTAGGFRHYDLDVDFGAKRLAFLAATGCADPNQIVYWPHSVVAVIPMTSAFGKISVPVSIDGHAIDAVIDTGSDRTVMRRAVAERLFGLKAETPEMTAEADLRDGTGARVYRHTFPKIAFEGVAVGNLPVLIEANGMIRKARKTSVTGSRLQAADDPGDPIPDLALGMDVLRQLHIYVAFGQNKLYVTPAG
jgi:predicted aspartyl protease